MPEDKLQYHLSLEFINQKFSYIYVYFELMPCEQYNFNDLYIVKNWHSQKLVTKMAFSVFCYLIEVQWGSGQEQSCGDVLKNTRCY